MHIISLLLYMNTLFLASSNKGHIFSVFISNLDFLFSEFLVHILNSFFVLLLLFICSNISYISDLDTLPVMCLKYLIAHGGFCFDFICQVLG